MPHSTKTFGTTETVDFTILPGENTYVYVLTETYLEAPSVKFYSDAAEPEFELNITNTTVTLIMPHTNGTSGELCIYIPQ